MILEILLIEGNHAFILLACLDVSAINLDPLFMDALNCFILILVRLFKVLLILSSQAKPMEKEGLALDARLGLLHG